MEQGATRAGGAAVSRLRLVGALAADAASSGAARTVESARREVAGENFIASTLAQDDARAVFAMRVAMSLDGGRAAILRPERRRALVAAAVRMGLRPFDANLVIAIVQDAAQRGERTDDPEVTDRLCLLHPATPEEMPAWWLACAAILLAGAMLVALVSWFSHGA